jgi:hypothetical protein
MRRPPRRPRCRRNTVAVHPFERRKRHVARYQSFRVSAWSIRCCLRPCGASQAGRGRHRNGGAGAARVEGGLPCAREVLLPGPARGHPAAGAINPIARGRAARRLLAHVLFSKYGLHLTLHPQTRTYAREGIELECRRWWLRGASRPRS